MASKDKWIQMGMVGVDSGTIAICDPGYLIQDEETWNKFCDKMLPKMERGGGTAMMNPPGGRRPLVAVVTSGQGDGMYPVEVRFVADMIVEARIRFMSDEDAHAYRAAMEESLARTSGKGNRAARRMEGKK
jgi:hypothetical protein